MDARRRQADGDRPGGDAPRRARDASGADASRADGTAREGSTGRPDALDRAAELLTTMETSDSARAVLAGLLTATHAAFTLTRATRDPLPDTAPGSAEEALAVLAGLDQLRSALAALDATWQVRAEQRIARADRERGVPAADQGRGAGHEIALARRVSPSAGSFSLAAARRLVRQLPGTASVLRSGRLTPEQATTVATTLDGASPDTCARIDRMISGSPEALHGRGRRRLASDLREMVQRLEPEGSRDRAERAARARHVRMTPLADGMARLSAVLPGLDAIAVMQSLESRAGSRRAAGARTPARALAADLLVDAVLQADSAERSGSTRSTGSTGSTDPAESTTPTEGTAPTPAREGPRGRAPGPAARPRLDIGVVITDSALFAPGDESESAYLEGYGTIPAHVITDTLQGRPPGRILERPRTAHADPPPTAGPPGPPGLAAQRADTGHPEHPAPGEHPDREAEAVFRRLYASPRGDELVAMESRARAFPVGLARLIRWRDVTCRTPWCNAVIRQIDHVQAHRKGGRTSLENGQGLCVRCNLAKEHGDWEIVPLDSGPGAPRDAAPGAGSGGADGTAPETVPRSDVPRAGHRWTSPHGAVGISTPPTVLPPPALAAEEPRVAAAAIVDPVAAAADAAAKDYAVSAAEAEDAAVPPGEDDAPPCPPGARSA
jgi:hypothetical protein